MSEKRKPDPQPENPSDPKPSAEPEKEPGDPKKIVFKIVSADPKNTLNFEDVADK